MPDSNQQISPSFTHVRTMHPYGYRSGQWAELLTIAPDPEGRDCLVVRFPDMATDYWVLDDPDGRYEFEART